jgi:DNA-binding GntR family transcriptional regulator
MAMTYERLKAEVISGRLTPGARLGEMQLASALGVSRPTIREALRRLESLGLATSDGRGLRVAGLAPEELRSALLMRASLEALHAELAATRVADGEVAPADLRRLSALASAAERATDASDHDAAVQDNRAFHQAIDVLAGSPVSAAATDRLWDRVLVATRRSLGVPGRGDIVNREHRELVAAIAAGEPELAADLADRHVRATLEAS